MGTLMTLITPGSKHNKVVVQRTESGEVSALCAGIWNQCRMRQLLLIWWPSSATRVRRGWKVWKREPYCGCKEKAASLMLICCVCAEVFGGCKWVAWERGER